MTKLNVWVVYKLFNFQFEFSKTRLRNDPDVLRTARNETMSTAVLEKMETRAVHRVK